MINKNSLLEAYVVMMGSVMTHIGMLVGLAGFLHYPSDISDDNKYKNECETFYYFSLFTHVLSIITHGINMFERLRKTKIGQVLHVLPVYTNIYLISLALDLYTRLHEESIL